MQKIVRSDVFEERDGSVQRSEVTVTIDMGSGVKVTLAVNNIPVRNEDRFRVRIVAEEYVDKAKLQGIIEEAVADLARSIDKSLHAGKFKMEDLDRRVEDLELSIRCANALQNMGVDFIGQLVQKAETDMLKQANFGRRSLTETRDKLTKMKLSFGMKLENWQPPRPAAS